MTRATVGSPEPARSELGQSDLAESDLPIDDLVAQLEAVGVQLWEDGGEIHFRAPRGTLTEARRAVLRQRRAVLLEHLREDGGSAAFVAEPGTEHEPFPLTDVQSAYFLGRGNEFDYGDVGCQVYLAAAFDEIDVPALTAAWRQLIGRHPMLRAVVDPTGWQRVLEEVPPYEVSVDDRRGASPDEADAAVAAAREGLCRKTYRPDQWPLFDVRVTQGPQQAVLHLSFDLLVADFMSIQLLLDELHQLYAEPGHALPEVDLTFRDYAMAERRLKQRRTYRRARDYWWARLDDLPAAPQLPLLDRPQTRGHARFRRWQTELTPQEWVRLRRRTSARGLSPSGGVLAAYAEVIGRWTRQERFILDVTLLNRLPVHPHVDRLVGDFTTVDLLEVRQGPEATFAERARQLQAQLWEDMDHLSCSGIEVLRELARRRGRAAALMPVVFTSAIALNEQGDDPRFWRDAELVDGLTQSPQVWIDCQVMVRNGRLAVNWDVRDGVFPPGQIDDMFAAFEALLRRLAADAGPGGAATDPGWDEPVWLPLPAASAARRATVNRTAVPSLPTGSRLHQGVVERGLADPDRPAVVDRHGTFTFRELLARAAGVAQALLQRSPAWPRASARGQPVEPGEIVAAVVEKGVDQVVAVLGILASGGVYLPIDLNQPPARRDAMLADAGVRRVVTQSALTGGDAGWPSSLELVAVEARPTVPEPEVARLLSRSSAAPDDLAYVIYTSGSTGRPKGVQMTHRSALNTVEDVNRRFGVGARDRVLGLANLGFDLSVYDLFGLLAAGGCLVLPDPDRRADPSHWAELVAEHGVTLWNSVPAQMQMLADYLDTEPGVDVSSLRLGLLSGDWIPVTLPDRMRRHVPGVELVSLGGATEAAIWSIWYPIGEVDPAWPSVPYGRPLANQTFHVLDPWGRDCPDLVAGELHIGGTGLAAGYLGDQDRTAERFVRHPGTGERLYRTGDLGRYRPDGDIEFLGREDAQVKIRGHRIELAEVEAALVAQPGVANAAVLVDGDAPLERRLLAFVEPARRSSDAVRRADGAEATGDELTRRLGAAAGEAGERVMAEIDRRQYVDYIDRLDGIALPAMLRAFRQAGLFAAGSDAHSLDEILARTQAAPRHHRVVRRWLRALQAHALVERDSAGRYAAAAGGTAVEAIDQAMTEAWREVDALGARLDPAAIKVHDYFKASTAGLADLLRGETTDAVQLLFPEGSVEVTESLYNATLFNRWANQVMAAAARQLAEASSGPLRVLEVGAGVGGTSQDVIPALEGLEVDYLFTDLSQFFLNQAKAIFGDRPWVRYATFDLDVDHRQQGLAPNSFDLVILGDVLHATRDVDRSVARLRELLAPDGWLLFAEMTRDHHQIMTSMELLLVDEVADGGFEDVRRGRDLAFVPHEHWLQLLTRWGDDLVLALPASDDPLSEIGLRVYATRVKADRVRLDPQEVLRAAGERLPAAMVPSRAQVVDRLPLTANAKVDRERLSSYVVRSSSSPDAGPAEQPADDLERRLAAQWADVLALPRVGRRQDFFELGGDSLLATQLARALIEQLPEASTVEYNVLLRHLLDGPTVAALAARLRDAP